MPKKNSEASKQFQKSPTPEADIDYSPKTLTLREQIVFALKLLLIGGIIMFLLWFLEMKR